MVTGVDRLLYRPYQLIRRPLAIIDDRAVTRLPSGNPVRELYHAALRFADDRVGRAGAVRFGDARTALVESTVPSDARSQANSREPAPEPDPEREAAEEQRRQDFAAKIDQVTRSNHSPAKMARELAQVRAAEEARERESQGSLDPDASG